MSCKNAVLLFFAVFLGIFFFFGKTAHSFVEISEYIKAYMDEARVLENLWIGYERIHAGKNLVEFYENRSFSPVWVTAQGVSAWGSELEDALADAGSHGLLPEDYHYSCIKEWITTLENRSEDINPYDIKELAGFDIVMSDAFLTFGAHLADGKVDPESIYPHWVSAKIKSDVFSALNQIPDQISVHEAFKELAPPYPDYWKLIQAAKGFQQVEKEGGWPLVTEGKSIRLSDHDARVATLRQRLDLSGYTPGETKEDKNIYDRSLKNAVRKFQKDHGLEPDGIVGKDTLAQLNISSGKRYEQILVNIERWRWLPRHLGQRHIRVNIADFSLEAVDQEEVQLNMRVIVGKDYQKTPIFSQQLRYLEFNPYWNVPKDIVREEILPQITKNPNYLRANHYEIVKGWNDDSPVVDPSTINWSKIHAGNFPGRLRQTPGPWNALGRIKFMFPNKFNVYLHDTPGKNLFQQTNRALSHGCIRLENPMELALFLFQDDPKWTRERIEKIIKSKKRAAFPITATCMIHLHYFTAWIGHNGQIQFRKDIYERDDVLWEALNRLPEVKSGKGNDHRVAEKTH